MFIRFISCSQTKEGWKFDERLNEQWSVVRRRVSELSLSLVTQRATFRILIKSLR
jgi:hypothetical protein